VNPIRVDSAFTALMELQDGLRQDDTQAISWAGGRLDRALAQMQEVQGRMAARAQTMDRRSSGLADEQTAAQVMLSNVRDVDITDAVVKFQQMQTALQANLATAARIMNLSLLNYLST
jgi:flagellar hook-associated protein 3 FlgL